MRKISFAGASLLIVLMFISGCTGNDSPPPPPVVKMDAVQKDTVEYFNLRPKLEKEYGYSHAVELAMILKFLVQSA